MLLNDLIKDGANKNTCEKGKVVKYLRTQGFKLDSVNRRDLKAYNLDACFDACTNNIVCSFQFLISIHASKHFLN